MLTLQYQSLYFQYEGEGPDLMVESRERASDSNVLEFVHSLKCNQLTFSGLS